MVNIVRLLALTLTRSNRRSSASYEGGTSRNQSGKCLFRVVYECVMISEDERENTERSADENDEDCPPFVERRTKVGLMNGELQAEKEG